MSSAHPWTLAQEKTISKDFPFVDVPCPDVPEAYIYRTYIQFLWLPESIMPLSLLIPSLERVKYASSSDLLLPHPLHALLAPCLLTPRSSANKYNVQVPRVIGGAESEGLDETEVAMLWYAFSHDASDEADEQWKKKWLERMERRELQIQMLFHFLLLSLPGPPPASPQLSSVQRRKRAFHKDAPKQPSIADRLESFMDKLSTWQLMGGLTAAESRPDQYDWMQAFLQDIIEPQFNSRAQAACLLLRSKLFPISPFADDESDPSPPLRKKGPLVTVTGAAPRRPSPAPTLARSRSLSVTLAQEQEEQRAKSVGTKRILSREISMSRNLKPKQSLKATTSTQNVVVAKPPEKVKEKAEGVVLVQETPVKNRIMTMPPTQGPGTMLNSGGQKEEIWDLHSSPDALLLTGPLSDLSELSEDEEKVIESPSKKRRQR